MGLMIDGKPADEFGGGRKNNIARTGVDTTKSCLLYTSPSPRD